MEKQKEYNVSIIETLQKEVEVLAASKENALEKVKKLYHDEDIVLCSDDFVVTEFEVNEIL